jgi:hypothetical protein
MNYVGAILYSRPPHGGSLISSLKNLSVVQSDKVLRRIFGPERE